MTTTLDTLTDGQITSLREQAFAAGDAMMGFICAVALGTRYSAAELNDISCLNRTEQLEIAAMDRDSARARVVAAITDAEAMSDEPDSERTERADHELDAAKDRRSEGAS
jgi:hypothetical protein